MLGASDIQLAGKFISQMADTLRIKSERLEALHVEVMIWPVAMFEGETATIPPAVRFAGEENDAFLGGRRLDKGWKIGRERGEGNFVNETMAFVVPGERIGCEHSGQD